MMNPPTVFSGVCLQLFQKLKNVRGNSLLICFIVFLCNTRIASATGSAALVSSTDLFTNRSGCLYAGRRYKNGAEVATAEKCLRCLCLSSNLVCRLRVCSQVPDPPPAGCILLQRANDCCRQLVCHQDGAASENSILEGRSRNGNPVLSQNGAGCLHNGTVYGEGSAMSTSSLCEYCYCIKGLQHCVKPQCVLAMPGCQPVFTKHSCCPIKYNCSHAVSTTTSLPILQRNKGCLVNGTRYQEGEMLDGLAKKCETCYCVQGVPRCEPVTCSVPSGVKKHCTPVYSDLHCCPTSYKCSQQSYEEMPKETRNFSSNEDKTVDLASERKSHTTETEIKLQAAETELFPTTSKHSTRPKSNYSETSKSPQKNNSETSRNPQSSKTNNSETAKSPQSQKNNSETSRNPQSPKANNSETLKNHQLVSNSALPTETTDLTTSEGRTETIYVTTTELTTDDLTTEDLTTLVYDVDYSSTMDSSEISTTDVDSTTLDTMTTSEPFLPTVSPSSTVRADVNETVESLKSNDSSSTTTVKSIPPELEAILNSTQNKEQSEDYDYDYNESSLPPSLPNLRIIPFVAADAVVAKTDTGSGATYPGKPLLPTQQRNKPAYYKVNHHNRFSPPTETEGGFVPKEPPTLDHPPYDSKVEFPYHSVGFNIEITVPPTADQALPASSANLEKMCIHNGKRYSYGDVVGEPLSCKLCVCYNYGEIVCQEPKCSPPQAGCTRVHDPTVGCCGRIVCGTNDLDSPTRVIDTPPPAQQHPHFPPATTNLPAFTIADPVVSTPDPFRDVIRTEPAPDLPSLIGQIIHLWDQPTTQQYGPTSSSLPSITTGASEQDEDGNRNGSGTGNGYGTVNGIGNGNSTGDVNEIGNKNGSGTGNETGNRNGSGTGNRNEFGNGNGTGHGNGIGNGNGTGNEITGSGVEKENGNRNWSSGNEMVDEVGKTGNGSNGIGDGSNGIGNIINGIGTGGNGIGNGSNGMGNGSNGIGTYEMRNGSNGLENGVNNGIVDHSNKGYVYNGNKNSNIDYSIINLEGGNNQGNDKKNISSENINSDRDSIYKESDFKVENNEEKIDNNNLHNQQNAQIDRIDVGFTSSEEEIYQTPIFKSNKTKTDLPAVFDEVEEDTSDSSPENVDPHLARFPSKVEPDSVFLPSVPSKVVVQNIDSKPPILSEIPRVEVVSKIETHVTSTESQVVSSTKNTLKSSTKIDTQQSITNKFDLATVTKTPTNNKTSISSSTTPRNIETTSKISDLSSFLFSTDESDVVNDHNDHDDDEDDSDPELKNEESDYSDNFSLDSVFKFFFDSGSEASEASTVKVQATETVTPPTSSTSTSRKPVSLKTPIFPVTTVKPSVTNKTSSLKFPTTTYSPVRVSPLKNTYFSSRITAKPVKDIINNSPKNVSTNNKTDATNHSKIDSNVDESKQEVRLSPDDFDKMIENEKLRTEKPIIYINRFHSVTSDHKTHNRTRIPGTIPRIPPSGIGNRNNVTGYKNNVTGAVTSTGSKFEKGSQNGTINKFVTGANSSNKVDSVRGSNNGTVNKFGNFGTVTPGSHKPDGVRGSNNGTVNKFSNFVAGNKIDGVRGTSNGTFNKFSGYAAINRTPGNRNTTGGIIKPLNRIPGVYNRVPGTVSRISSTTAKSSPLTDDDEVQHISAVQPTTADPSAVTGLLKLAGCNIYGRMYRVGKIIAELSGPCLECMCTEVGVQCRPLPC